ncbi:ABC transporter permease/substrate-binding protein [Waddlia chondrophila]|nr:ABC transporter permease/substrate-binding protein [Waddlia chondrophila]
MIALICLFWLGWEWMCLTSDLLQFSLPPPSKIINSLWTYRGRFLFHTISTFKEMAGGFALASVCAFPLAWLMARWKVMRAVLQPLFIFTQCIPMFALAPLMVLWFDWSYLAVIVPTALMIFFPLTMNLYRGLVSTPQHLLDFFRLHEATSMQIFWKLRFPWAVPYMWAGLRISAAVAGIGAVAGEWAGAQSGLGILMLESRRAAEIDVMFGALFCLSAMSFALYACISLFERNRLRLRGVMAALFFIVMIGCQAADSGKTRLVLDWLPNPNHVPLYAGIAKGFFKEHGIDLEIKKIHDPSDPIPLLISRQTDLAISYSSYVLRAVNRGAEIKPVGILIEEPLNCLIYRKNLGIDSISDLNGKVIGYSLDGSETRLLRQLLQWNHVVPKELKNLQFDLVGSLAIGRVDAFYGGYWNIESEQLHMMGVDTDYFSISELGIPPIYELVVISRRSGSSAEAFKKALQKSIDYSLEHPEEAFALYLDAHPDKSSSTRNWEKKAWLRTLKALPKSQSFDWERWEHFFQWMDAHHLL